MGKFEWVKRILSKEPEVKEDTKQFEETLKEASKTGERLKELKQQVNEFEILKKKVDILENKNSFLEQKISKCNEIIKELIETVQDVTESYQTITNDEDNDNLLQKLVDVRLQTVEQKQQELNKKYDVVLDIIADKISKNDSLPNLFVGDISLRELWRKHPKNKDVLLYSIAYLMKKDFEEKGVKIR